MFTTTYHINCHILHAQHSWLTRPRCLYFAFQSNIFYETSLYPSRRDVVLRFSSSFQSVPASSYSGSIGLAQVLPAYHNSYIFLHIIGESRRGGASRIPHTACCEVSDLPTCLGRALPNGRSSFVFCVGREAYGGDMSALYHLLQTLFSSRNHFFRVTTCSNLVFRTLPSVANRCYKDLCRLHVNACAGVRL